MTRDAFRDEEAWGERQNGDHAPDATQRVPSGGSNERPCGKCSFPMFAHRDGCPDLVRVNGYPMLRSVAAKLERAS